MTKRGYEQAREKLDRLKNVELPRLEKALGDARDLGAQLVAQQLVAFAREVDS